MKYFPILLSLFLLFLSSSCGIASIPEESKQSEDLSNYSIFYVASGCFWCVEAVYESVKGVIEAESGYSGGETDNPTYQSIGTGRTGHAEAVKVYFDPEIVSFKTLVEVYFHSGDPTTVNGQGPDNGSQYRSILFYQSDEEKKIIEEVTDSFRSKYQKPIATEIVPFEKFYIAEEYHQDFESRNPSNSYVKAVSIPRLNRFKNKMPSVLK